MSYNNYLERLSLVNKDHETRTVWTSIDKPMRPLIYQLHRIGLRTKFCCCGYPYPPEGGEEPKSHTKGDTYVLIYDPVNGPEFAISEVGKTNLKILLGQLESDRQRANMAPNGARSVWKYIVFGDCIKIHINNWMEDYYSKDDDQELSIHDYEPQVVSIFALTRFIQARFETAVEDKDIVIVDGNQSYFDLGMDDWQVKPKQDCKITPEILNLAEPEKCLINSKKKGDER